MDASALPPNETLLTSAALLARQAERESNARTYPRGLPLAIAHARGCEVYSVEGIRYLDFFSGAGVLAVGHNHPKVVEAVRAQLDLVVHALDLPTPTRDQFVSDVLELLPRGLRDQMRLHICAPTGSDAIEAALKLCKRATGREPVVAFQGAYHGMTTGALAATSCSELRSYLPGLLGVTFAPYSYCKRCPLKLELGRCGTACAAMFETLLEDSHSGVSRPAAVLMEFVQGEGGGIVPRPEFAARIGRAAQKHGVPLIADEIQAGLGRTGRWFAFEHFDVQPDVIALSKALGGIGLPIAAILYRKELDVWEPGTHIGTFRGHQLAMAAGSAAIRVIRSEGYLDNASERGAQLKAALASLSLSCIGEVRGLGLMLGIELIDPATGAASGERARAVRAECFARGLLCELGGRADATVRLLPPLCLSAAEATEGAEILLQSLRSVHARFGG